MLKINKFFNFKKNNLRAGNETVRVRRSVALLRLLLLFCAGMLLSSSMPPLNWHLAAWIAIVPLYWLSCEARARTAWLNGFVWGLGWAFTGFFWLREIHPAIPYAMAVVLALYPACWAMLVPVMHRAVVVPNAVLAKGYDACRSYSASHAREFLLATLLACWWCVMEWGRAGALPWNYVAVSQWRNLSLLQISAWTGTYGLSFLIVLVNIALAVAIKNGWQGWREHKYRRPVPLILALTLLMLTIFASNTIMLQQKPEKHVVFDVALVQGDIQQCRQATDQQAEDALQVYLQLSREITSASIIKPDLIIWPETAVPYPYRGAHPLCRSYRHKLFRLIQDTGIPLLIGTIDFEDLPPGTKREPGTLNSAFLFDTNGKIKARYDKVHPVPFGEYVPFRRFLPQWIVSRIDMKRDLTPGASFDPLPVYPGVKAGISICFEDIFPYIARREVLSGANLLLVITNDAWYPTSSEPEQHLANAVFRTVETGLPMLRNGNNSASCLIQPNGYISDCLFETTDTSGQRRPDPEARGRRAGVIRVTVPINPKPTFYTRYGDVFLYFCMLLTSAALFSALWKWRLLRLPETT